MIIKTEPNEPLIPPLYQEHTLVSRSPGPSRRRRARMVDVLLPTRKQIYGHNPPLYENATSFIEKNALARAVKKEEEKPGIIVPYGKVEIKKEEVLSEDVVNRRLALVEPYTVDLDPAIRDVTTTRKFTSKRWGGDAQSTFPSIRSDMVRRHGLNDFMYLNLFFNPHAPQFPGAPGLFFASSSSLHREANEWNSIERVLVRLNTNRWLYVGQYRCLPAASLTPEEWKSQSPKVKQTWMTKVSTQAWGRNVRAKIVLRKRLGRDPTAKEFDDSIESGDKFHATPEEVLRAFDEGHAVIRSWCMKCVGYDENFQREIAAGNTNGGQ